MHSHARLQDLLTLSYTFIVIIICASWGKNEYVASTNTLNWALTAIAMLCELPVCAVISGWCVQWLLQMGVPDCSMIWRHVRGTPS